MYYIARISLINTQLTARQTFLGTTEHWCLALWLFTKDDFQQLSLIKDTSCQPAIVCCKLWYSIYCPLVITLARYTLVVNRSLFYKSLVVRRHYSKQTIVAGCYCSWSEILSGNGLALMVAAQSKFLCCFHGHKGSYASFNQGLVRCLPYLLGTKAVIQVDFIFSVSMPNVLYNFPIMHQFGETFIHYHTDFTYYLNYKGELMGLTY